MLSREKRLRRVAILCCHVLRNAAFYRAGSQERELNQKSIFWRVVNGNFLDICVLEWCKLFCDKRDKHCYMKIVEDKQEFYKSMVSKLKIENDEFENYIKEVKFYRDKFVAHLDDEEIMRPPYLDYLIESSKFYFSTIINDSNAGALRWDAPINIDVFYENCLDEGKKNY